MRTLSGLGPSACHSRVERLHAVLDAQRRDAGAPGMVLEQRRRAPEGHHAVADELVDRAVLLVDRRVTSSRVADTRSSSSWVGTSSDRVEKSSRSEKKMVRKRLWPPSSSFWSVAAAP